MPNNNATPKLTQAPTYVSLVESGLELASRGIRVFECHGVVGNDIPSCTSKAVVACRDLGKHPSTEHGFYDATTDARIIRSWREDHNLAIATGKDSGIFVVDVDPRNGGLITLALLERQHGPFQREAVVVSGGGGLHFYYAYPARGARIGKGTGVFGPGVDLLGNGASITAPPSRHKSLKLYEWWDRVVPQRFPAAPPWLLAMARAKGINSKPRGSNDQIIQTKNHERGQIVAEFLSAKDRGTYWLIDCPADDHPKSPTAGMYPHDNGQLWFVCYSGNPCSHRAIAAAIREAMEDGAAPPKKGSDSTWRDGD